MSGPERVGVVGRTQGSWGMGPWPDTRRLGIGPCPDPCGAWSG